MATPPVPAVPAFLKGQRLRVVPTYLGSGAQMPAPGSRCRSRCPAPRWAPPPAPPPPPPPFVRRGPRHGGAVMRGGAGPGATGSPMRGPPPWGRSWASPTAKRLHPRLPPRRTPRRVATRSRTSPSCRWHEPPEEEEEEEDEDGVTAAGGEPRGPPRELTFSYIAFQGGGSSNEPAPRCRRDSRRGRPPRLSSGLPGGPLRGPDPRLAARAPPKRPEEPPPPLEGQLEVGGGPTRFGGPSAPAPQPPPAVPPQSAGGALLLPPPAPPPDPPSIPDPPPAPPEQSLSPPASDVLVWELLYWRAPGRSALVLVGVLGTLGCLARFSAISVGAYGALATLAVTVPLRLHRVALRVLRRHPPEPPCRTQPEGTVGLSPEEQQRWARRLAQHLVAATHTLTRLFLVHSVPESLKFAFFFYLLTYVGAVCNGLTLLGAGVICAFTFPVLYRHHQAQIDQYVSLVRSHLSHLRARIQAKLSSAKVKPR
ncbi:LOW QUALITY PROTEIN: reticulon-2 [Falco peregrinus]|uniref:LOW QUALITY PROTEIN: reticulon-2 n=1 Tax=Falco peregrinus TaxID=8954 RepID=UPI002479625D|nr:LOW QUALITY PROTEIN: reticulon-2 [Falco peregrinus]